MKFDFFLLKMQEIILIILTQYHQQKALVQWFNIKPFNICFSNKISAFYKCTNLTRRYNLNSGMKQNKNMQQGPNILFKWGPALNYL